MAPEDRPLDRLFLGDVILDTLKKNSKMLSNSKTSSDVIVFCKTLTMSDLGSSEILKTILTSVESADGNGGTIYRIYNHYLKLKVLLRKWREDRCHASVQSCFDVVYTLYNMFYYALRPFLGASALYFDICKDVTFAVLIYSSLWDLAGPDHDITKFHFEAGLFYVLVSSIILVQVCSTV